MKKKMSEGTREMGNLPAAAGAFYTVFCVLFLLLGTGFLTARLFGCFGSN